LDQRILIVDKDTRAHALAWKIARDRPGCELFVAPGNAGLGSLATPVPLWHEDIRGIVDWCRTVRPDLVIVGPCRPLRYGIVDALASEGIPALGPTKRGARLEASKGWAARLARAAGIPMPATHAFHTAGAADAFVERQARPYVVKPDGEALAAAVTVSDNVEDTHAAIDRIARKRMFGVQDARIVLQERVHGREIHVAVLTDGATHRIVHAVRGYKHARDGAQGTFTSGMGSHAPVSEMTPSIRAEIEARILTPLLAALRRRGVRYTGFIEVGLMLTAEGPVVLELNCRLGCPSANVILPLLRFDLLEAMEAAITGGLDVLDVPEPHGAAVCVMLRRRGAKEDQPRAIVDGLESAARAGVLVFHSLTAREDGIWLCEPGASLAVTGLGATVAEARERAYAAARRIRFLDADMRTDIAAEADWVGVPVGLPAPVPIPVAVAAPVSPIPVGSPS
jgi:phosphoribosylamine--glycine ligase